MKIILTLTFILLVKKKVINSSKEKRLTTSSPKFGEWKKKDIQPSNPTGMQRKRTNSHNTQSDDSEQTNRTFLFVCVTMCKFQIHNSSPVADKYTQLIFIKNFCAGRKSVVFNNYLVIYLISIYFDVKKLN